jgi:diguanylate cyclase (GGDEF)-like protein
MTSIALWLAASAAFLTALLLLVVFVASIRRLRSARRPGSRLPSLPAPLTDGELAVTIELDTMLDRVLGTAATIPTVDAAIVVLWEEGAPSLAVTRGVTSAEAASQPLQGFVNGAPSRSMLFEYVRNGEDPQAIAGGAVLPLPGEAIEAHGVLAALWRGTERKLTLDELSSLEGLAGRAGPALENARRFQAVRNLAEIDPLTRLYNHRYFHETVAREVRRAQRYERNLALVVIDIDDFKLVNDAVGHLAGDDVLASFASRLQDVVRGADIPCRIGGDEFAIILPESRLDDARECYERLRAGLGERPIGTAERLSFSAGIAEVGPADDESSFFERADRALYRAKDAGKAQAVTDTEDPGPGNGATRRARPS